MSFRADFVAISELAQQRGKVISFSQGSVLLALFHGLMHSMMPIIFKCILDPEQNLSARACVSARALARARARVCDSFSCGGRGRLHACATESLSGCHGKTSRGTGMKTTPPLLSSFIFCRLIASGLVVFSAVSRIFSFETDDSADAGRKNETAKKQNCCLPFLCGV